MENERDHLRLSEQQLRAIVDTTPECVKLVARDGTLLQMNPSGLAMIGAPCCDLVAGRNIYDFVAPEHRERFRTFNEHICDGGKSTLEFDIIGLQGMRRHMESHAAPLRLADGRTVQLALTRDVTARKNAERTLRELSARIERERRAYDAILSSSLDFVYAFDRRLRCTYANQALLKTWGRTWEATIGRTFLELGYEPRLAALHEREMAQVFSTKEPHRGEIPSTGTNGRRVYDYIFVPIFGDNGEVEGIAGTTRDITDLKAREEQLRFLVSLNTETQSLTAPDEIMRVAARLLGEHLNADRCAYAEVENEKIFVITGDYPRDVPSIVGRWDVAAFGRECMRSMLANESFIITDSESDPRLECEAIAAYQATRIRAVVCVPLHKDGRFTAAMAVHQTTPRTWTRDEIALVELVVARCWESLERARAHRKLRDREERLRFMAEMMPQKLFTAQATGEIDYVNPQWRAYTGVPLSDFLGWRWLRYVHQEDRNENLRRWHASLQDGHAFECEHRFRRHDGRYRWHLTRARPMRDERGNIVMWIGSTTDIEGQKRAEEDLEQVVIERTAQLRETIGELEAFSYSVAHDLRAPLRSLQGFSDILLDEHAHQLAPDGQEFLRRISNAASRMDKLVQDVLNYSRVVRADLPIEDIPLEPLVRSIVATYPQFTTDRAKIEIVTPLPTVRGNEAMLTQAISNLLGNAVKFVRLGERPHVRIWGEIRDGLGILHVRDNGIGIAPDQQQKIFDLFQQINRTYGGTGIGLAIVKKSMERLNGRVLLESSPGQGSTFSLELSLA